MFQPVCGYKFQAQWNNSLGMKFAENYSIYKRMYSQVSVLPHETQYVVIYFWWVITAYCSGKKKHGVLPMFTSTQFVGILWEQPDRFCSTENRNPSGGCKAWKGVFARCSSVCKCIRFHNRLQVWIMGVCNNHQLSCWRWRGLLGFWSGWRDESSSWMSCSLNQ